MKIKGIKTIRIFKQQSHRLDTDVIKNSQTPIEKAYILFMYYTNRYLGYGQAAVFSVLTCWFCCNKNKSLFEIVKGFYERTKNA